MIRAWRITDGRYRLERATVPMTLDLFMEIRGLGGEPGEGFREMLVPEKALVPLKAEKVYGVVTGPSSCGCEPAMFRWVGASEVEAGRLLIGECVACGEEATRRYPAGVSIMTWCDIIDVCGEPDVAREVFEAEFAAMLR